MGQREEKLASGKGSQTWKFKVHKCKRGNTWNHLIWSTCQRALNGFGNGGLVLFVLPQVFILGPTRDESQIPSLPQE